MHTGEEHLGQVLASVNGRSAEENEVLIKDTLSEGTGSIVASEYHKKNYSRLRTCVELLFSIMQRASQPYEHEIKKELDKNSISFLMTEIANFCVRSNSFAELMKELPKGCGIFNVTSINWADGPGPSHRIFVAGRYAFLLPVDFPKSKVTEEDVQDYITLKTSGEPLDEKGVHLMQRLQAMDVATQLDFWVNGYPVHKGPLIYLEYLESVPGFHIGKTPSENIWILRQDAMNLFTTFHHPDFGPLMLVGKQDDKLYVNTGCGICVPDFSCCGSGRMIQDKERRKQIAELPHDSRMQEQAGIFNRLMKEQFPGGLKI